MEKFIKKNTHKKRERKQKKEATLTMYNYTKSII